MDPEKAWAILVEKKTGDLRESRTAFLAALFIDRARKGGVGLTPHMAQAFAAELAALAGSLKALAEMECNYELTPGQVKRQARLSARFAAIGAALGFRPETSGDPRGPVCRLFDPTEEGAGDGWGGGWAVYA